MKRLARHVVIALILLVAFVSQETWALAGVTGGLTGVAVDADTSAPVAGATVTANSPSQTATVTTDAAGHFSFLTLSPDTYTVTVTKSGYQTISSPGEIVFADTVQTVSVRLVKALKTIAHVTSTGAGALVKSGTTNDVYSVNSAAINKTQALGGGGSLNSAYSAIASVPGAYVPGNNMGYYQTVVIRGGDYDQVGYEFDGVPVNRSFDNYPSSSASSLGNSEVQVYTGSANANAESQGLAGYINQVIKTGTFPGYADGQLGIGTPTYYHKAQVEVGGATPDRNLSWYFGVAGYNQDFNYVTQDNNQSVDNWAGVPMAPQGNPGYAGGSYWAMGAFNYASLAMLTTRDTVANVHVGIPHHNDAGRDDVQILWDSEMLLDTYYDTTNDITSTTGCPVGGATCANAIGLGQPAYTDALHYTGSPGNIGQTFSQGGLGSLAGNVNTYYFPSSTNRTAPGQPIPVTASDSIYNNQEIFKLQYTKNIGSTSFLRLYGYTYYSDWLQNGPQTTYNFFGAVSPDYELTSHTRGVSLQYQNQFNAQNLLSFESGYTTSSTVRDNNAFYTVGSGAAVVVNAADPLSGYCYTPGSAGTQTPVACTGPNGNYQNTVHWNQIQGGACATGQSTPCIPALPSGCVDPNVKTTACTYLMSENGLARTYNAVTPRFFDASLTDEFRPSDRWLLNVGLRLDDFTYIGANTATGLYSGEGPNAREFWTNSYNLNTCFDKVTGTPYQRTTPGAACGTSPDGNAGTPSYFSNSQGAFTFPIWQPRVSGTYTVNPDNVLRFSMGRYTQGPVTAFQQYNRAQDNIASYDCNTFCKFGRFAPIGAILPATSLNYDVSWESHLKGTDWSFKLTPFLRQTQNQNQEFFLDQKTGFVSGLDVGSQRSQGVEFQLQKGDFSRNGISGQLSFAYTNSYIKYGTLTSGAYGTSVLTTINQAIASYNAYTAACAPGGKFVGKLGPNHVPYCGSTSSGAQAAPCYTTNGAAVSSGCNAGDVGNPYWNNPQQLFSLNANYPTFSLFPGAMQAANAAFGAPYVATLLLNYKHDKFSITPSLQFEGGMRYGAPLVNPGIDPAACPHVLAGVAGVNGGGRYDAARCGQLGAIPDTYTGQFDEMGSFLQPNNIAMNLQLAYDVSPRVTLQGVLANIFNTCWGGSVEPWTFNNGSVCSYNLGGGGGLISQTGNVYNPAHYGGSLIQAPFKYPYGPVFNTFNQNGQTSSNPFNFFVTATVKI